MTPDHAVQSSHHHLTVKLTIHDPLTISRRISRRRHAGDIMPRIPTTAIGTTHSRRLLHRTAVVLTLPLLALLHMWWRRSASRIPLPALRRWSRNLGRASASATGIDQAAEYSQKDQTTDTDGKPDHETLVVIDPRADLAWYGGAFALAVGAAAGAPTYGSV